MRTVSSCHLPGVLFCCSAWVVFQRSLSYTGTQQDFDRCLRDNAGLSPSPPKGDNTCSRQARRPFTDGMEHVTKAVTQPPGSTPA